MHSKNRKTRLTRGLALAAFGAVAVAGCDADREDFIQPIGDVILDMAIENASPVLPEGAGAIDVVGILGFDTSVPDAFGRATGPLGLFVSIETPFGAALGFDVGSGVRNASQDTRLPALEPSDAEVGDFFGLFNPAFTNVADGWWDLFGEVAGLEPNTMYTIALARMSLTVNGELDAQEIMLTGAATEPDSLSLLGGAEAGSSLVTCNFSAGVGVDASRNPVSLGINTTDGDGLLEIDCLPVAIGDSPWWRSAAAELPAGAADSVPVGINSETGGVVPGQYNYVLIFEGVGVVGNPVPDVNPTVRIQIGPDIDAAGNVIHNALAPFPDGFAPASLIYAAPGGTNARVVPTEVSFTVDQLAPLSGVYQVWLFNEESGDVASPTADITITNVDELGMEVIVSETMANSFNTSDVTDEITIALVDATAGVELGDYTHVFLSIEGAAAGTPGAAQPLWAQYLDMVGAPEEPSTWIFIEDFDLPFGSFGLAQDTVEFVPGGFGQGAFTGEDFGTTDYFRARFRNLGRPPVGYFYEGFMRQVADEAVTSETSTGDLTTEFDEGFASLRDVDVDPSISAQIGPSLIIESANRATLAEVGAPFESFEEYVLKLRPKLANSPTEGFVMLLGTLPEPLKAREGGAE